MKEKDVNDRSACTLGDLTHRSLVLRVGMVVQKIK